MEESEPTVKPMAGKLPLPSGLVQVFYAVIATLAFAMMALMFVDVFMRYVFNSPIPGAFEIEQFMLALLIFMSLPIVVWADENISIDLFTGYFRGRLARVLKAVIIMFNIAGLGLLGAVLWRQYFSLQQSQQATGYLNLPLYPLALAMVVMIAISIVIQVLMLLDFIRNSPKGGSA